MRTLLSIVVPVYNVEKYLPRCIDSILVQTFTDYELILVNDGSTDSCPTICDEYAKKNKKIKVIHKVNEGLSEARNTGIHASDSKYIAFIDSDDFIIRESFERLINKSEIFNLDIVTGNAIKYFSETKQMPKYKKRSFGDEVMSGLEFLKRSYVEKAMAHCVPFSIYKLDLIKGNNIYFKSKIYHEDNLWTPQIFLQANRVMYHDIDFYFNFHRTDSITNKKDKTKNGIDLLNSCQELGKIYKDVKDKQIRKVLNNTLASTYIRAVCMGRLNRLEYSKIVNKKFPLINSCTIKNLLKSMLFYFSTNLYVKLFGKYYM